MKHSTKVVKESAQARKAGEFHSACFVCGSENSDGLQLMFIHSNQSVMGELVLDRRFQSYDGVVHGGIVISILDAAMVHCIRGFFGREPFTCKLATRFHEKTPIGKSLKVVATLKSHRGPMFWAEGKLFSGETLCAKADGVFRLV